MKKSIVYFLLTSVLMLSCIFTVSMNKCYANQITINEEYGAEVMQDKFVALWPDAVKKNMNSLYGVLLDSQYKSFIAFQPASNGYVQEIYVATDNTANLPLYLYNLQIIIEGYDGLTQDDAEVQNVGMEACNLQMSEYYYFYSYAMNRWYIYQRIDVNGKYAIRIIALTNAPS